MGSFYQKWGQEALYTHENCYSTVLCGEHLLPGGGDVNYQGEVTLGPQP